MTAKEFMSVMNDPSFSQISPTTFVSKRLLEEIRKERAAAGVPTVESKPVRPRRRAIALDGPIS